MFDPPLSASEADTSNAASASVSRNPVSDAASTPSSSETEPALQETRGGFRALVPVPEGVRDPVHLPEWHRATARHRYLGGDGALLGHVLRIDEGQGRKRFLPLTYGSEANGPPRWVARAHDVPRPLYGLDRLAGRLGVPVLVVEGERTADAATGLLPEFVAMTSPSGAKAANKADWRPLADRDVTIWPDNDEPGTAYAREVAKQALEAGARSARIVRLPDGLPPGWDLADALPVGFTIDGARRMIAEAVPYRPTVDDADPRAAIPSGFRLREQCIEYCSEEKDGEMRWHFVCSRLDILAEIRNSASEEWGLLLRVTDPEARQHIWAMPRALIAGDGTALREHLSGLGLRFDPSPKGRTRLLEFIARAHPPMRALCATKIGWHGNAFVLPDTAMGESCEPIYLQSSAPLDHAFSVAGSLAGWRDGIGQYCVGNSRLVLAVCAAFAAPCLHLVGMDGGGFHLRGESSTGKTTALRLAASVCGDPRRYVRTWRTTANGLEGAALAHNDALLALDELGQVDGSEIGPAIYMLANGEGKSRARKDATARQIARWRTLFLSTGEQSLKDKAGEARQDIHAGQEARLIDVPADAEHGKGIFEALHGFATADAFARAFAEAVAREHGTPLRAFLDRIAEDIGGTRDRLAEGMTVWIARECPPSASGQVKRVARRFALLAMAGEEAARLAILPWPPGEASRAIADCFHAWLAERGGIGAAENLEAVRLMRRFLEQFGQSRFARFTDPEPSRTITNRAGYRRDGDDGFEFLILRSVFEREIFDGRNARAAARALRDAGHLVAGGGSNLTYPVKLPIENVQARVYRIAATIIGEGRDADESEGA